MKKMKKLASILLALVMAMALTVPAFAEGETEKTITINSAPVNHTYGAFQIFKGDVYEETKTETVDGKEVTTTTETLSNVQWGDNIASADQAKLINELGLAVDATARDVAEEIAKRYASNAAGLADILNKYVSGDAVASVNTNDAGGPSSVTMQVVPGYYLIKDTADISGNDTATDFILEVVGNATVTPKSTGTPEPGKQVKDTNDSTGYPVDGWGDSADHDVGDIIDYQLTAKLPESYTNYKFYNLKFTDTLDKGLTLEDTETNLKVFLVKANGDRTPLNNGFVVSSEADKTDNEKTVLTVNFDNLKTDKNIEAGDTILIEYKAKLNDKAVFRNENKMFLQFTNDPNYDGTGEEEPPTGDTPPVTVVVFTYNPVVNKVDGEKNPLKGAEFTLYKWAAADKENPDVKSWVKVALKDNITEDTTTFTFKGIDDGVYKLVETKTPDGYNTSADIYFEVTFNHSFDGNEEPVVKPVSDFNEETGDYKTGSATDSPFKFVANMDVGTIEGNVENLTGAQMPETGGIGTTIFYTLGGLMVVAAGVLLVTKRRMQSKG